MTIGVGTMKTTCFIAILLVSSAAAAQGAPGYRGERLDHPGIDLAVRVGYAIPFGDVDGRAGSLSSRVSGAVPFILEAGYRFDRHFTLGPYFQYAVAQINQNASTLCTAQTDCSGWVVRAGVEGLYHLAPASVVTPWVGLGLGYEWANYSGRAVGNANGFSAGANGWEFLNLQLGGDVQLAPSLTVGPFVSFSIARYANESGSLIPQLSESATVSNPAVHEWLQLGVRFAFNL